MLGEAALSLGVETALFTDDAEAPAIAACDESFVGPLKLAPLQAFFRQVPTVVFENEFLDCELLARAAEGTGVRFLPPLSAIEIVQDKLRQKELLVNLELATAPFVPLAPADPVERQVAHAVSILGPRLVFKTSRLGYDGNGVFLADLSPSQVTEAHATELVAFLARAAERGIPVYAEKRVAFVRELAIVSCLSREGEFAHYPLVITEQDSGICDRVTGPATALGVPPALELEARRASEQLARAVGLVGTYAIEFFQVDSSDPKNALLINEIAPRVHNSGHYSQDATRVSQFENHVRAASDIPVLDPEPRAAFAMVNLIGPPGVVAEPTTEPPSPPPGLHLHWYGKTELRPRRKLGHVNAACDSPEALSGVLDKLNLYRTEWIQWAKKQT
jgi:5-(carboxyamino)imidazole ribonucleotide synthase